MTPSRRILWAMVAAHALAGIVLAWLPEAKAGQAVQFVLGVATVIAIYAWCKAEAEGRGTFAPGRSALWAALFPVVFVPVYFFRTRPPRSALVLSLKAYAFYVALCLLTVVTGMGVLLTRGE